MRSGPILILVSTLLAGTASISQELLLGRESQALAACEGVFTLAIEQSLSQGQTQHARAYSVAFGRTSAALFSINWVAGAVPDAQVEAIRYYREGAREMLADTPAALADLIDECRLTSDAAYSRQRVLGGQMWEMNLDEVARMIAENVRTTMAIP